MSIQLPLTAQQLWLWMLLRQHSDWKSVAAYAFRIQGALHIGTLQKCFDEVIRRHGSLRTRFVTVDGEARQEIDSVQPFHLEVVQVPGESKRDIEARAASWIEEISDAPVDIAADKLLIVRLLKLAESEHWLVIGAHRLIGDCHSIDQISQEVWALYGQFVRGEESPFTHEPAQYGDYTRRQHAASADWLRRHEPYWRDRLAGATALEWRPDEGLEQVPRNAIRPMNCRFGESLSAEIHELARRQRTLSASVMFAIYAAVLWRWHRQKDFVVPFMIAGRQSDHKSVIGYFSHILYLRIQLSGGETLSQLLSRVSNEFLRALSHQDFGRVATQKPELLSGAFFQWITWHLGENLGPATQSASDPHAVSVQRVAVREFAEGLTAIPPGRVDVEVTFFDTAQGIYASGVHRADRFAESTMNQFMDDLRSTAEELVKNVNSSLTRMEAAV